jgi:hypothetical protein
MQGHGRMLQACSRRGGWIISKCGATRTLSVVALCVTIARNFRQQQQQKVLTHLAFVLTLLVGPILYTKCETLSTPLFFACLCCTDP